MAKRGLSGLDASFLYLETPEQPMHVASVCLYELSAKAKRGFLTAVRNHLQGRLHLAPLFTHVVSYTPYDLGHPSWEPALQVDMSYHVKRVLLPKPGNLRQLEAAVAAEHATLMDRSKPLWEFIIFDGLQAGGIAFYAKVHHASLDGQGGVVLANAILDLSEVPREVPPPKPRVAAKTDLTVGQMIGAAFSNTLAQYAKIVKSIPSVAGAVAQVAKPMVKKVTSERSLPMDFAPRTPFNVNVSVKRVFSTATLPMDGLRMGAKVLGGSLNDGVLFVCSSALRSYLKQHNALPKKTLVAAMPVSLREESNKDLNNQSSMVLAELGTHHGDARKRWNAIRNSTQKVKDSMKDLKGLLPTDYPGLLAPLLMSRLNQTVARTKLMEKIPPVANLVISNVPGPQVPLYLAGAKMMTFYPVSIIVHGIALNVTVHSYCGGIYFGVIACGKAVPDVRVLTDAMASAYDELVALAEGEAALKKEREAKAAALAQTPPVAVKKKVLARKRSAAK